MNIKLERLPKSRVKITVDLDTKETEKYFEMAYEKLAPNVEIKGFRKGQAPKLLTLESIGFGRYSQEALDLALSNSYYEAIQKEKVVPIQPPSVSVKKFSEKEPLSYEAEVDVVPTIELSDYKSVKIKHDKVEHKVSKEEVEKVLEKIRYQKAIFNDIDRGAEKGDRVEIDFEGSVNNVVQENLCSKNYPLILGEGILLPGFEKEITGKKKNEKVEFDLEVPETKDRTKLKKAHFKVSINDVKETILPDLDEKFAKEFGHDNPEKLESAIEKSILDEKIKAEKDNLEAEVLKKVVEISKIDLPESLIEQEMTRRLTEMQNQMGPGFYKYLESIGKKIEDIKKDMRPISENSVKTGMILGEIARKEKFINESHTHDQKKQEEVIRKTIEMLVDIATK